MLPSNRVITVPTLGASLATRALAHRSYRLHVVDNLRVTCEDALALRAFDRRGVVGRPVITVVIAGEARIAYDGAPARWLGPGAVAVLPHKGPVVMRQQGARFTSVVLEWDPGTLGPRPDLAYGALSEPARRRVAALAERVVTDGSVPVERLAACVAELLALLRAEGVPLDPTDAGVLVEPVPPATRRLALALDRLLSQLETRPAVVDIATDLAIGERHVHPTIEAFNVRYGFNALGWRDALLRRRLTVGAALMSVERARTEDVARILGYSSPTAFCRAMAQGGLPAPGGIRASLAQLL